MRRSVVVLAALAACGAQPQPVAPTLQGAGPVLFGMQADAAMGALDAAQVRHDTASGECGYLTARFGGVALRFMVESGRVLRVDVDDSTVAAPSGARIGISEDSLQALYAHRLVVRPHKYTDGHYLIFMSPQDSLHRIVFETDGQRVTTWRSGLYPAVEYVEGCS